MAARASRLALALTATMIAVASCQGDRPTVSLEEAKRITVQIERRGFAAPPRNIADITAVLDQQKPDPARAAANRRAADAKPPPGMNGAELSRFYFARGLAAAELGRANQRVADLRKAAQLGREAKVSIDRTMQNLAIAEQQIGNGLSSLHALQEWTTEIPSAIYGEQMLNTSQLASAYSRLGDFESASKYLRSAKNQLAQAPSETRKAWPVFAEDWTATVEAAEATILAARGQYSEAEAVERDAIANREKSVAKYEEMQAVTLSPFPREGLEDARDFLALNLGRILTAQGRLLEAEIEVRRVLLSLLRRRGRDAPETAGAVVALAQIIEAEGRYPEAERLGGAAVAIYENLGAGEGSWSLAEARILLAETQGAQGRWDEALGTFRKVDLQLADDPAGREKFVRSNLVLADVYINLRQPGEAVMILRRVVERSEHIFGENSEATAEARGLLAAALAEAGQLGAAFAEFNAAVPILLHPSRDVAEGVESSAARDRRYHTILEAYIGGLADAQGAQTVARIGDVAAVSFPIADAIRGRSVQRALAASSARAAASDPALAALVRQEQDAQKQIAALQSVLTSALAAPFDQQDREGLVALRGEIDMLRSARAALREDIERKFPGYANLIDPRPATIAQVRAALRPGEALIATYVGQNRSFVWAVPATGDAAFSAVPMDRGAVGSAVAALRRSLDPQAATLGDIPPFDVGIAYALYSAFLLPVEAGLRDAKSLLIVPHGALGQLPFAVLVTEAAPPPRDRQGQAPFASYKGVKFLARSAAITQLPSVTAFASLRALPSAVGNRQPFVGFGDPWFNRAEADEAMREAAVALPPAATASQTLLATRGVKLVRRSAPATQAINSAGLAQLPRLPETAEEVRQVALALGADPARDVFTGREANERRVRTMDLSNRKVVMFATHGLVPGDLNGLTQPALALTDPGIAAVDGDGLLTLDKVLALKLNADWVVLSACNTAASDGAGAEAVSGLGQAFFYAGTRAILVSNWPVETNSARTLTTDLFRRQAREASLPRAEALRQAEMALIDGPGSVDPVSGSTRFSYAHPLFWAPFSLVGDGG
jgi:CHAT domain-containing protein